MDAFYLKLALEQAWKRKGKTAPNPSVGAVLTKNGKVIGTGFHWAPGHPHAEVKALAGAEAKGCTLYVTLEPCSHFGRTPPCVDLILQKKIKRVVFGHLDPNPLVSGKGVRKLKANGVLVEHIPLPEIEDFYTSYDFWTKNARPFFTFKVATSLNFIYSSGSIEERLYLNKQKQTLEFTQWGRLSSDFILTTGKTIHWDNPRLNVRLKKHSSKKTIVVLEKSGKISKDSKIFKTAEKIIIFYDEKTKLDPAIYSDKVECFPVKLKKNRFDIASIVNHSRLSQFHEGWIEAGGELFSSFCTSALLNRVVLIQSNEFLSSGKALPPHCLTQVFKEKKKEKTFLYGEEVIRQYLM